MIMNYVFNIHSSLHYLIEVIESLTPAFMTNLLSTFLVSMLITNKTSKNVIFTFNCRVTRLGSHLIRI